MAMELDESQQAGPSSLPDKYTRGVSRTNKAIAAISGAAVTSLMSACSKCEMSFGSSLIISLLIAVTPFDVIKTRLQTQVTHEPLFQPSSSSPPGMTCCQSTSIAEKPDLLCQHDPRVEKHLKATSNRSAAGISRAIPFNQADTELPSSNRAKVIRLSPQVSSGTSAIACDFPDKDAAVRELERSRNHGRLAGLWDGVTKIGRTEGRRGLWRGLTPTL